MRATVYSLAGKVHLEIADWFLRVNVPSYSSISIFFRDGPVGPSPPSKIPRAPSHYGMPDTELLFEITYKTERDIGLLFV